MEHGSYMGVSLVLLLCVGGIFLGVIGKSPGVSFVSALLWLGIVVQQCKAHGDEFIGAFFVDTMMLAAIGFVFMIVSFVLLGAAKVFETTFPPDKPKSRNVKQSGQKRYRR